MLALTFGACIRVRESGVLIVNGKGRGSETLSRLSVQEAREGSIFPSGMLAKLNWTMATSNLSI